MKKIFFTSLFLLLVVSFKAQESNTADSELYPAKYTFEKAGEFQQKGEFDKAIWYYINLFPSNQTKVIETVKAFAAKHDTIKMPQFIKMSFAKYAMFDPEAGSTKDNPAIDFAKVKVKGAWGDELIQKITDPAQPLSSASEYNFRGLDKFKAGDLQGAIADFDKAVEIKPMGQIYFNRAYAKGEVKDHAGAIEDYNKVIEAGYRVAEAYYERGYNRDQLGSSEEAIADYSKAIELEKDYVDAYNNRGVVKLKLKDYKGSIKDFDHVIKLKPGVPNAYVNRGFAYKANGDKKEACKDWKKAEELGFKAAADIIKKNCE